MPTPRETFQREIIERDKQVELYSQQVFSLYQDHIYNEVEQANEDNLFTVANNIRSPFLPNELRRKINSVDEIFLEEFDLLGNRFDLDASDVRIYQNMTSNAIELVEAELSYTSSRIASGLILAGGILSLNQVRQDFLKSVKQKIDTEIVTSIAGYRSTAEINKATGLEEQPRFIYVGPIDNRNRPFCRHVLTKKEFWTIEEIHDLDNHPDVHLLPVIVYRGGYNCRHRWIYASRS